MPRDPASPIVSVRYFPKDVPFTALDDPGLEAPPIGRRYERVVLHEDGFEDCSYHDFETDDVPEADAARGDGMVIAQSFAAAQAGMFLYRPAERAWRRVAARSAGAGAGGDPRGGRGGAGRGAGWRGGRRETA